MSSKRLSLLVATVCAAAALPAAAQFQKPEDAVKYRQATMTVMANHFGRIGAMANGRAPYSAESARANAEVVNTLAKLHWVGFVEGTAGTTKGSSSPKVWSERAKFDDGARKMETEIARLLETARGSGGVDALKAQFGEVGKTCKGCHDDYRNP